MAQEIIQMNENNREELFSQMYDNSYYTIIGVGGDINEWIDGYTKLLEKENIGKLEKFIVFTGKDMNRHYGLYDSVAYKDDLTFLAFPLDGLDTGKLAMFKLYMKDRWFDDICDNNRAKLGGD